LKLIEDIAWTTNYLIKQLHYLETFEDEQKIRKYEKQVNDLIYCPVPTYVMYKRDLLELLNKEMDRYGLKERHELLKTGVARIFENPRTSGLFEFEYQPSTSMKLTSKKEIWSKSGFRLQPSNQTTTIALSSPSIKHGGHHNNE